MTTKKVELVVGAGDWESLTAAIQAGADAVYVGVKEFNLRINAQNFELNELRKLSDFVHAAHARLYVTVNGIIYQSELDKMRRVVAVCKESGVDAIICWDFAVTQEAVRCGVPVHISTQASISNAEALRFMARQGISRVVLARECTIPMIQEIKKDLVNDFPTMVLEVFVHGAMCISLSGRCYMSEFLYNRSANRGDCLQPCRRKFRVTDLDEGGEMELGDGYVLSPKDLCTIDILDELIQAGVGAMKIEGRTRPCDYIKTVTKVYRAALDDYGRGALTQEKKDLYKKQLGIVYTRGFSHGFYRGRPVNDLSQADGSISPFKKIYAGDVVHYFSAISVAEVRVRAQALSCGDAVIITGKKTGVHEQIITEMELNHEPVSHAEKGTLVALKTTTPVRPRDKVFIRM